MKCLNAIFNVQLDTFLEDQIKDAEDSKKISYKFRRF